MDGVPGSARRAPMTGSGMEPEAHRLVEAGAPGGLVVRGARRPVVEEVLPRDAPLLDEHVAELDRLEVVVAAGRAAARVDVEEKVRLPGRAGDRGHGDVGRVRLRADPAPVEGRAHAADALEDVPVVVPAPDRDEAAE